MGRLLVMKFLLPSDLNLIYPLGYCHCGIAQRYYPIYNPHRSEIFPLPNNITPSISVSNSHWPAFFPLLAHRSYPITKWIWFQNPYSHWPVIFPFYNFSADLILILNNFAFKNIVFGTTNHHIISIKVVSSKPLDTTLCDKVCQQLTAGRLFSPSTPVSSTNKTSWCNN